MAKLKNSNCDKTQKHKLWQTQIVTNCDKTQKFKLWPIQIVTKLKNSNADASISDITDSNSSESSNSDIFY